MVRIPCFEPNSLIVPARGVLHIIVRSGFKSVRSRNIHRVHEILQPYIDGNRDEEELAQAVPLQQRTTVYRYLATLAEAGAIKIQTGPAEAYQYSASCGGSRVSIKDILSPGCTRVSLTAGATRVFVSLNGICHSAIPGHDICIFFVNREQARDQLLNPQPGGSVANAHVVVTTETEGLGSGASKIEWLALYAEWLVANSANSVKPGHQLWHFYCLDRDRGALTRLFVIREQDLRGEVVPDLLGLVKPVDVEQVPLVIASASHPFFPVTVTRAGLSYAAVRNELLVEFVTRCRILNSSAKIKVHCTEVGKAIGSKRTRVPREKVVAWPIARSWHCLRAILLEQRAIKFADSEEVKDKALNLLDEPIKDPGTAYLARVLRLRVSKLNGRFFVTNTGLSVYECNGIRRFSFIQTKALHDILLALTLDTFYEDSVPKVGFGGTAADTTACGAESDFLRLIKEWEARLVSRYGSFPIKYGRRSGWGKSGWFGAIVEPDE